MVKRNIISVKYLTRTTRYIILGWLIVGLAYIGGRLFDLDVDPAIAERHVFEVVLGFMLSLGSLFALSSALRWQKESTAWALELLAWPILASAWGLYSIATAMSGPWVAQIALGFAFSMASINRMMEVLSFTRETRKNVRSFEQMLRKETT